MGKSYGSSSDDRSIQSCRNVLADSSASSRYWTMTSATSDASPTSDASILTFRPMAFGS
ncbi:hypothetical protein ACFFX0_31180 [Citricoccus parietis]|uniref:Uncharacterized protein n=1 Tax=Citricoccus parietis TaxID=592307 RepID=A0ABV5G8V0_9MICC